MAIQNTQFAVDNVHGMFNAQGYQNVIKPWASMNERMTSIFVDSGTRLIDIVSEKTKEAFSNLREVTQVRDELAGYGQAYSDFVRKQMNLLKSTRQEVGEVAQQAGTATQGLASDAGQELNDKITANVKDAADKAASNAESAIDRASSAIKKNV
jgi:hypothetical protein